MEISGLMVELEKNVLSWLWEGGNDDNIFLKIENVIFYDEWLTLLSMTTCYQSPSLKPLKTNVRTDFMDMHSEILVSFEQNATGVKAGIMQWHIMHTESLILLRLSPFFGTLKLSTNYFIVIRFVYLFPIVNWTTNG